MQIHSRGSSGSSSDKEQERHDRVPATVQQPDEEETIVTMLSDISLTEEAEAERTRLLSEQARTLLEIQSKLQQLETASATETDINSVDSVLRARPVNKAAERERNRLLEEQARRMQEIQNDLKELESRWNRPKEASSDDRSGRSSQRRVSFVGVQDPPASQDFT